VPEHIHAFRKEFEDLLKAADIDQLVILIDDLDRCLPETAIATLEAVRLFLFVPNTAFVVGADEAMIEYSVRRHFPDLTATPGAASYARNYLEKLIQVPFRIPALGIAETRAYITLLLSQRALGEANPIFQKLLEVAREDLRRPWRSRGLDRDLVRKALGDKIPAEVEQALLLSGQITHILTEGTRGNPRQIKRFLNSMALRQAIARERGFDADVKVQVLAKLMLAERFATDFYDQLGRVATGSPEGKVAALARLEASVAPEKSAAGKKEAGTETGDEVDEWMKNEWIRAWAGIEPGLGATDLRPYVFVTRDKRAYYLSAGLTGHLDTLVERLMGQGLAVQGAVPEIQKLGDAEAQQVFDELKTRILQTGKLTQEPHGVRGVIALAKAKPILQPALLQMLKDLPPDGLGAWAATSSGQAFTSPELKERFNQLLAAWQKSGNAALKAAAGMAVKVK
jgi:predicted KAP-like P-loop ATPase